jgi:RNA polymerase sigma factor (sigma-70 family)
MLAARIKAGDAAARERMILANMGLVVNLAHRYADQGDLLDDLIQEGMWGLIRAVDAFDPQKHNTRFSTYAAHWIRKGILLALEASGPIIHVRRHVTRPPIAIARLLEDVEVRGCGPDQELVFNDHVNEIAQSIDRLSTVESFVVRHRFGLDCTPLSAPSVARRLRMSTFSVCQIERAALTKLRGILDPGVLT